MVGAAVDFGSLTLVGQEVSLLPLAVEHAPALARAAAESRAHYAFTHVPDGEIAARRYVESALAQRARGERHPFAIVWRERVAGTTSYMDYAAWTPPAHGPAAPSVVEIGYTWLAASAQRTRCNTEAKYLLLKHAFETWRVHRVALRTDARNARSRRAIERLGARLDGVIRADKLAPDGVVRDSALFSIVAAEWPEVSARLARALAGPAPSIDVRAEDPRSADAVALIRASTAELSSRYPDAPGQPYDPAAPDAAPCRFVLARVDGVPAGCGALRRLDEPAVGEIKRMFVRDDQRRRGLARRILVELEGAARELGMTVIRLETGVRQPEAIALYERAGYARIAAYGEFIGDPLSVCFEKHL